MASVAYGSVKFKEQIAFFRAKRDVLTESWLDVFGAEHDTAFMVAGANRSALLADFRDAIDRAIADGATLADFRKDFDAIAARHGWDYNGGRNWRSRVVYETNLRQSYNAGTWAQLQRLKRYMPYWQYRHSDAVMHPRPLHQSWDGLVLHADDPWWHTHYPANGWGCKCSVHALSERDLRRLGKSGPDQAPPIEWETLTVGQRSAGGPRLVRTPVGIDPGFGYAPGRSLGGDPLPPLPGTPPSLTGQLERAAQHALDVTARLPALEAARSAAEVLGIARAVEALDAGYAQWQSALLATRRSTNAAYLVGALTSEVLGALQARRIEVVTAAIIARDVEVLHALRDAKSLASLTVARALTAEELARLPALLRSPLAVLLDVARHDLVYVVDASARRETGKIVVSLSYRLKTDAGKQTVNSFRTASLVDLQDLRAAVERGELRLVTGSIG